MPENMTKSFFTKSKIYSFLKTDCLRWLYKLRKNYFFLIVILPLLILLVYYVLIASSRYESSAIVALKQNESTAIPDSSLGLLSGFVSQNSTNDYLLVNYILSTGMLDSLNNGYQLKKIYQNPNVDYISRLSKNANKQDFLDYYHSMVSVKFDQEASMITLSAQAFNPNDARNILVELIKNSQQAIDHISHTLATQRMNFAEAQMNIVRNKALKSQQSLLKFQNNYGIVDPENSITAVSVIINGLQTKVSTTESELTALQSYLNEKSPEIQAAKQKIMALKKQIAKEKTSLLSIGKSNKQPNINPKHELNQIMYKYSWLKLNAEFSISEYTAAMQSYEMAKIDTLKQQSYLVTIVKPTLPDEPEYPKTWYNLLTVLIILLALYGIGRMIITIILEHR